MGSGGEQRAREARFWELLGQGMGRPAACDAVGVHPRQGYRWFKAARGKNPFERASRSGRYLSEEERLRIADLRLAGVGIRRIAGELGRAPSTISRELARNSSRNGDYRPYAAESGAALEHGDRNHASSSGSSSLCRSSCGWCGTGPRSRSVMI